MKIKKHALECGSNRYFKDYYAWLLLLGIIKSYKKPHIDYRKDSL